MNTQAHEEVTQLLAGWNNGDTAARDRLATIVYGELRRMAHRRLLFERRGHTMQTGTLANEVYLRLFTVNRLECRSRREFFSIVARQMLEILIETARKRQAAKRGGDVIFTSLEDAMVVAPALDLNVFALKEALNALAERDGELSQAIELHYLAGFTIDETAELMNIPNHGVKRLLLKAKIYLHDDLTRRKGDGDGASAVETN